MIRLEDITKTYSRQGGPDADSDADPVAGELRALDHISLTVNPGEWLAIMGPSGSGKSTLVNLIGCLDRPSSGALFLDGENVATISTTALNRVRAEKIGFVFQQFHLIPYLTAVENIMLAQYFHSMTDQTEALAALDRVGLKGRAHHLPNQLSGGEQQRVCIARALINDPRIILADEPTGNLDAANEEIVLKLLRDLHKQGRTIVMVTHDPVVARLADRRIDLHHGKIDSEVFSMSDEEQFDEVLEEIWVLEEHGDVAEPEHLASHGALPVSLAVDRMEQMGLIVLQPHPPMAHGHTLIQNPCHAGLHRPHYEVADGARVVTLTDKGRQRAAWVIRRHRLAEHLLIENLGMQNLEEIAEQACKLEHILSGEATERICGFLGHPRNCPHGAPIPRGECCRN